MENTSDDSLRPAKRTWMPTTAGILAIVAGSIDLAISLPIVIYTAIEGGTTWQEFGVLLAILIPYAIVALIGGVFALKRKVWGMALAGAICAVISPFALGIPAIIFIAISKQEFN
jgi:hypothetical protein